MNETMTELEQRAGRAVAALESAARLLGSPYVEGLVQEAVAQAVAGAMSPWADRQSGAAYCHCSLSEFDRAAGAGFFPTHRRSGTPMFKKSELDAAIESGRWLKRGEERKAA